MASTTGDGVLYGVYRKRVGEPTTHDEVRGYWVFLTGLVLGTLGILLFLPSTSAVGTSGLTLREASIFVAAVGLAMLVAGPVIRLPLQPWANYAAYLGQTVCFAAAVWFLLVFPAGWSVQTGNQPVIVLYGLGLAITTIGGVVGPLVAGASREDLEASESKAAELETRLSEVREERDRLEGERADLREERADLEADLEAARSETANGEAERTDLQATVDALRESRARFELYRDAADEHRWRLRHENGTILATSGRGHTARRRVKQRVAGVRRHALGAGVLTIAPEDADPEAMAEDAEPIEYESRAEFEVYEDSAGEYRWRLVHENGNLIADGGEGYTSRRDAKRGLESARAAIDEGTYLAADPTAFEIYRDRAGKFRWRLVHRNGNVLADGGQGYARRSGARDGVESVRNNVDGDAAEFEVYEDSAGEYRWRLVHENGNLLADSGQGYESRDGAEEALGRVREYAPDANTLDIGRAAFEIFEDRGGKWRWRLRHRNGNVLADGGQGYASRSGTREAVDGVKRNAPGADVVEPDDGAPGDR